MTAGALLASVAALASPAHAHHHHRGCPKTYTVHMDTRAARAVYAGTRHVPRHDVRMLAKFVRCQRYGGARPFVRSYNQRARRAWVMRARAAVAWSGPAIASWYDDAGTTGCGFHAGYGIATFVVGCGGKVTLRHGSSTVTAVRDDSGPYVSGRTFDLDPAVKAALGCSDLCSVDWRVG